MMISALLVTIVCAYLEMTEIIYFELLHKFNIDINKSGIKLYFVD